MGHPSCNQMAQFMKKPFSIAVLIGLVLLAAASSVFIVKAAVTLTYFIAQGQANSIRLTWETASELDNSGYYIRRSLTETGTYNRISAFIPSLGDSLVGATYYYTDTNVTIGTVYWYQLESVDFSQNSQFYDPVSAVAGSDFATQTAIARTPTATASTPTATATVNTATPTSTRTATQIPAATATGAYPGPATSTLPVFQSSPTAVNPVATVPATSSLPTPIAGTSTATAAPGEANTGAATLIPLPEITLIFETPEPDTATPAAIAMSSGEQASPAIAESASSSSGWLTPGRLIFLGLILLVWVILGVWFFVSMKRVQ